MRLHPDLYKEVREEVQKGKDKGTYFYSINYFLTQIIVRRFLLDKGYRYKYFFKNGEESFCFEKDNHLIDIEHIGYPFGLNIVVYSRAFSVGKISCDKNVLEWKNINEVLDIDKEKFKNLSPIQVIDDYAEIIENHFDEIENAL